MGRNVQEVVDRHKAGETLQQIGDDLGITRQAVSAMIVRARRRKITDYHAKRTSDAEREVMDAHAETPDVGAIADGTGLAPKRVRVILRRLGLEATDTVPAPRLRSSQIRTDLVRMEQLVRSGLTRKETAAILGVNPATVQRHCSILNIPGQPAGPRRDKAS